MTLDQKTYDFLKKTKQMKKITTIMVLVLMAVYTNLNAHCEVPCGIYNDQLRIELLSEHFTTIEKAMKQINKLSEAAKPDYNQLVRWINTKEEHAKKVQEIMYQYFMCQRIKIKQSNDEEAYNKYISQLSLAHKLMVLAMKTKQSTDVKYIADLRSTLKQFTEAYFSKKDLEHLKEHLKEHKH